MIWTVTEVYYFKKSASVIAGNKYETRKPLKEVPKTAVFMQSQKAPSSLNFVTISLNRFEQPRSDKAIGDIRNNDFNGQ
jgi:hypothetical protein